MSSAPTASSVQPATPKPRTIGERLAAGWERCENSVLGREFRARMRGVRSYWITGVYATVIMGCVLLAYVLLGNTTGLSANRLAATVGRGVWLWGTVAQALLLPLIVPAFTCGAITLEREREMLELLLLTRQSALQICIGKLFSGLGLGLTLLLASVPTLTISLLLGGVSPGEIFASVVVLAAAVTASGTLGLAASTVAPRTVSATVLTYVVAGGGMIGFPAAMLLLGGASRVADDLSVGLLVLLPILLILAFPPSVGFAYGLYAWRQRRNVPPPKRVWWIATVGFSWCFLLLGLYLPGVVNLLLNGKMLLYLHPVAVITELGAQRNLSSGISSTGSLPPTAFLGFSTGTAPFSSIIGVGTELWWFASLCYLAASAWFFYMALVRVRRLRAG